MDDNFNVFVIKNDRLADTALTSYRNVWLSRNNICLTLCIDVLMSVVHRFE